MLFAFLKKTKKKKKRTFNMQYFYIYRSVSEINFHENDIVSGGLDFIIMI